MWAVLIVLCVTVLGGWYGWPAEQRHEAVVRQDAGNHAGTMKIYRQAVVAWFQAHDVTDTSVSLADLKQAGVLPGWSGLATGSAAATWANYRDSAGRIYIFPAAAAGAPPIIAELLALSRNSLNVHLPGVRPYPVVARGRDAHRAPAAGRRRDSGWRAGVAGILRLRRQR